MQGLVQQTTSNGLRKVVNDVSQLTNVRAGARCLLPVPLPPLPHYNTRILPDLINGMLHQGRSYTAHESPLFRTC